MLVTERGDVYYVDHINKRTSWDPPLMSSGGQSVIETGQPDIRELGVGVLFGNVHGRFDQVTRRRPEEKHRHFVAIEWL